MSRFRDNAMLGKGKTRFTLELPHFTSRGCQTAAGWPLFNCLRKSQCFIFSRLPFFQTWAAPPSRLCYSSISGEGNTIRT